MRCELVIDAICSEVEWYYSASRPILIRKYFEKNRREPSMYAMLQVQ
jgi:hypothetical protein